MEGTLIAFSLATYNRDKASELVKRLYGQATSSHGGKHVYRRKGLRVAHGTRKASMASPAANNAPATKVVTIIAAFEGIRGSGSPPARRGPRRAHPFYGGVPPSRLRRLRSKM